MMNMKIAIFAQNMYPPRIEGIKNNSYFLASELSKQFDVKVISHRPRKNLSHDSISWFSVDYLLKVGNNRFNNFVYYFIGAFKSLFFLYKEQISIINFQYLETSFIVPMFIISLLKPNAKFILTLYSTDEVTVWYKKRVLKILKFKLKKIVIVSNYLESPLRDLWFKIKNIVHIPLSYDKRRYLHCADFAKRDKKTILFSAWPIQSAWSFLMVDLALLMPDFHFIFAMRKFNQKSERELGLLYDYIQKTWVKNIEVQRNISQMEDLLWRVWALVLPLQDINIKMLTPIALLEAMARWTICFVSDLPNLIELLGNSKAAILFRKSDVVDLKRKILKYIDSEDISHCAFAFAQKIPSYAEISQQYLSLICSLW